MSINDPITLKYNEKHGFWYLVQDIETFYDDQRRMRTWEHPEDAIQWCRFNLHTEPYLLVARQDWKPESLQVRFPI